jgi:hypothetical protein
MATSQIRIIIIGSFVFTLFVIAWEYAKQVPEKRFEEKALQHSI